MQIRIIINTWCLTSSRECALDSRIQMEIQIRIIINTLKYYETIHLIHLYVRIIPE